MTTAETLSTAHPRSDQPAARRAVLHRLLDASLAFAPDYETGMASHLPMALAALDGLGASEAQMTSFYAHYAKRLHGAPPVRAAAGRVADWHALRGRVDGFGVLHAFFIAAVAQRGRDAVLREALPALLDGAAGAAMHGPIRVAHAVESSHAGELAAALAYWATSWSPLPVPRHTTVRFDFAAAWLDALDTRMREAAPHWRTEASLISERMQQAARTPAYAALAGAAFGGTLPLAARLADLAHAAASRYAATGNFTVLHLATGARALQVLSPWMSTTPTAWAPLLHAVAAASIASCAAPLRRAVGADVPTTWAAVRRQACAGDDDHVIKLVHAMVVQHKRAPDPVWLRAARVALGTH